ncbi:MAG: GyrI-like domain-containing protein [Defluviitaleaceae bacterium]|nr:GyrI-like domain-containing protein [Defluviitaleaceae bacterium]
MAKKLYSIGDAAKISKITKKALRFYDELDIIRPDKIFDNRYRYYTIETLLMIPVLKYFKQMGFTLAEIRNFIHDSNLSKMRALFLKKIATLEEEKREWHKRYTSVVDWTNLIEEAQMVLENNATEVSVKFKEGSSYFYMKQPFKQNTVEAIINMEFTNEIENNCNAITGPVIIKYPSHKDRTQGDCETMTVIQKTIFPQEKSMMTFDGGMYLCCYHIGSYDDIASTYKKMIEWSNTHRYKCSDECFERYVVDYWTTKNPDCFVTEIMINVSK